MFKAVLAILLLCNSVAFSQGGLSVRDSSINLFTASAHYQIQLPFADLSERFGYSHAVGPAFRYKFKGNAEIGFEYNFQFGGQIKEDSMLQALQSPSGYIISNSGQFGQVLMFQRGHVFKATIGYLFPVIGPNPNSGIMFRFGVGYWTHKIRMENNEDLIPLVMGDYRKGYDRKAGGLILSQFVGFHLLHNKRRFNFFAGITAWQGFTMALRSYQFDLMGPEPKSKRFDANVGVQIGWIVPIYRRAPEATYYAAPPTRK
jgi:hypothetical protein